MLLVLLVQVSERAPMGGVLARARGHILLSSRSKQEQQRPDGLRAACVLVRRAVRLVAHAKGKGKGQQAAVAVEAPAKGGKGGKGGKEDAGDVDVAKIEKEAKADAVSLWRAASWCGASHSATRELTTRMPARTLARASRRSA